MLLRVPATVEFHVPISPTVEMLTMVRVLSATLFRFSGVGRRGRIVVTVGAEAIPQDLEARLPWLDPDQVEIRPCPDELFARRGIQGTAMRRMEYDFAAEVVVLLDADLIVTGRLDDLVDELSYQPAIAGVIAHATPFKDGTDHWPELYEAAGLPAPQRPYRYTGWPYMAWQQHAGWEAATNEPAVLAPPYFNFGVVGGPSELVARIPAEFENLLNVVSRATNTPFRGQIALTLALEKLGIPHRGLPMRYNFGNDVRLEALHPRELEEIRIVHVLRRHQGVDKRELYRSVQGLREMVDRTHLWGANEAARRALAAVIDELESTPTVIGRVARTAW